MARSFSETRRRARRMRLQIEKNVATAISRCDAADLRDAGGLNDIMEAAAQSRDRLAASRTALRQVKRVLATRR